MQYAIKEHSKGLWVLEEDGQNVLLKDAVKFGLAKAERLWLFQILQSLVAEIGSNGSLEPFIGQDILKCLDRQKETQGLNMWEIRDPGRGGRIIFIRKDPDAIVVAAVDKRQSALAQAIRRGVKRWKNYLKEEEK